MRTRAALAIVCAASLAAVAADGRRDDIESATRALGGADWIHTLQVTASGATFSAGQNFTAG
jgi:hypothetical protein